MLDMYSEKLVRRKPSTKTIVLKAAIATLTMFLAYLVFYIFSSSLQLIGFMPIAVAAILFVGWKAFTFFNTEYEYTVTNGSLDIDKIVAKKSRKRLCTVLAKNIETLAPYTPDYRGAYDTGAFKETIDARSDEKNEEGVWYVVGEATKGGRVRILFEPDDRALYIFERNIPLHMPYRPAIDESKI